MVDTGAMVAVDLNADLGEAEVLTPMDAGVLDAVTSVSIACGFHAGSRKVMRDTARACVARGVAIGAHVSFRDSEGFGRRTRDVAPAQLIDDIIEQCATLLEEVGSAGGTVAYVKPHGALYHQMSADAVVATSVVSAVSRLAIGTLLTQSGSEAIAAAHRSGLRVVLEGFPDRGYLVNGRLAPRHRAGAVVDDPAHVADRAVSLIHRGGIEAMSGQWTPVAVETLCIHGDSPSAAATAAAVRAALESAGIAVRPFVTPDGFA